MFLLTQSTSQLTEICFWGSEGCAAGFGAPEAQAADQDVGRCVLETSEFTGGCILQCLRCMCSCVPAVAVPWVTPRFNAQAWLAAGNMMLFDAEGKIKRYETPEQILEEFYDLRLDFYHKRKAALLKVRRQLRHMQGLRTCTKADPMWLTRCLTGLHQPAEEFAKYKGPVPRMAAPEQRNWNMPALAQMPCVLSKFFRAWSLS